MTYFWGWGTILRRLLSADDAPLAPRPPIAGGISFSGASKSDVSKTQSEVQALRDDVYRMALFVQTLINALLEKGVVTDERLNEIMTEVDLSDGEADGQLTRPKNLNDLRKNGIECPRCARLNRRGRLHCLYCGAAMPDGGEWLKV
jgi:hypothetical protein